MEIIVSLFVSCYYIFCMFAMESYLVYNDKEYNVIECILLSLLTFTLSWVIVPIYVGLEVGKLLVRYDNQKSKTTLNNL